MKNSAYTMKSIVIVLWIAITVILCVAQPGYVQAGDKKSSPDSSSEAHWIGKVRSDGKKMVCIETPNCIGSSSKKVGNKQITTLKYEEGKDLSSISVCDIKDGKKANIKQLVSLKANTDGSNCILDVLNLPDGKRIIYSVAETDGKMSLWEIDPATKNKKELSKSIPESRNLSLSLEGKQIVGTCDSEKAIAIFNSDGSGFKKLIKTNEDCSYLSPQFIAGANKIAFISYNPSNGMGSIYTAEKDNDAQIKIDNTESNGLQKSVVSPDGTKIVFFFSGHRGTKISVIGIDGADEKSLPIQGEILGFSKDGLYLYYIDNEKVFRKINIEDENDETIAKLPQ